MTTGVHDISVYAGDFIVDWTLLNKTFEVCQETIVQLDYRQTYDRRAIMLSNMNEFWTVNIADYLFLNNQLNNKYFKNWTKFLYNNLLLHHSGIAYLR